MSVRLWRTRTSTALLLAALAVPAMAQQGGEAAPAVTLASEQLRHIIGTWNVSTSFLGADGAVAASFEGTYQFDWVVPDRVARGVSRIPKLDQTSAIIFYVRPATREIEMVSVGGDGMMWVMTGKDNAEMRETAERVMPDGSKLKLRFTRFNVAPDQFESRMDVSTDSGQSWRQANHQLFRRCGSVGVNCGG